MSISAPLSQAVIATDSPSTSHGSSKEGAAIGVPVAVLSAIIIFLVVFLIRQQRRAHSKMANTIYPSANSDSSAKISVEQQRSEVPAGIAATEMEAQRNRSELVA